MEGKLKFLRFVAYAIEVAVLYVLSGTPGFLPEILGVKPLLLLPVAITIAAFENEVTAMIFGVICGALCDIGFGTDIGFYTIALTLLCFAFGYCARNFFVTNFVNAMVIGSVTTVALLFIHFLIFAAGSGMPNLWGHFAMHYLIRILYTLLFLPPLFWFNRLFRSSMVEA